MSSRYTLRLWDGNNHYDFPCHEKTEQKSLYHSVIENYPIRAVRGNGQNYEMLRRASEKVVECRMVAIIEWINNWQLQLFFVDGQNGANLCITGYDIDIFSYPIHAGIRELTFENTDKRIIANFDNRCFQVYNHDEEDYEIHHKKYVLSKYYNEESQVLLFGCDEKLNLVEAN